MILFGLYTGQRLGDVAMLTWHNVDLLRGEIRLVTRKTGKQMILPIAAPLRKHLEGYTAGRPNRGGSQFKFKFCESASFIVGNVNGKRSVSLKLFDGTDLVSVGNVAIPANKEIPKPSEVVEVRYLYACRRGSIFQPVYKAKRDDIQPAECCVDRLKFKSEPQTGTILI